MTGRAEQAGLAFAAVAHLVLLALLSVAWGGQPPRAWPAPTPLEVSLVDTVAPEAQAPPAPEPPAASIAPEVGAPEDAAPPAEPAPQPVARLEPATIAPARPAPAPLAQARPQPPARQAAARPAPAKPSDRLAGLASSLASGSRPNANAARPRGARLGNDFLAGLAPDATRRMPSVAGPATRMGAQSAANIGSAILRQVQPCANRQVKPGPGAERIRVEINLRLTRDGSLASTPRIIGHTGVDDDNRRYVDRVDDLAIATFVGCSPLRGLPDDLYDVQNGWSNFTLRYKLPG